jgi:CPA2 family monovalent cation:H+ antiporter-2
VLERRAELETVHGVQSIGILLVQDIAVIPCVVLVTVLVQEGSVASIALDLGKLLLLGALAALALYGVFTYVVPRVLRIRSVHASRELSILMAIVSGLGAALLAHQVGLSPGLGAFLAGMFLGGSPFSVQVRADLSALRTLFVTVFFSSIGAFGDPGWMLAHWQILLPTVLAIIFGKSLMAWGALRLFGAGTVSALAAGICLGQIGEFSFIMIEIARGKLLSHDVFLLLVSSTFLTMLLTPYLIAAAPRVAGYVLRSRVDTTSPSGDERSSPRDQVLIVGFGPAGRVVGEQVCAGGGAVVVLDLNPRSVADAHQLGFTAFVGDGQNQDVLLRAGVRHARVVVVTVPAPAAAIDIVRLVRIVSPGAVIVARSRYNRYYRELRDAGAHDVHDEETHVGIRMSTSVLELIGPSAGAEEANRRALSDNASRG